MLLTEVANDLVKQKAGFVPYIMTENGPLFMFMITSNPLYGGSKPMLSKGGVD